MNGTIYVITEARLLSVAEFLVFKFGERAIELARLVLHVLAFVGIVENRVTFIYIYIYISVPCLHRRSGSTYNYQISEYIRYLVYIVK